jgi:hypothetical protein
MDVLSFLCVALGSNSVQFHVSLGSRSACACSEAGFSSQNGDIAWGLYYRRAVFSCALLWVKWLNAKDIHMEMLHVYGGKCLSLKRFTTGWQTFRWWRRDWNGGAKVSETTVKRLQCSGFRRPAKAMGQVYQCWWRICWEINVFGVQISHVLRFISFVTYLLTLPRTRSRIYIC